MALQVEQGTDGIVTVYDEGTETTVNIANTYLTRSTIVLVNGERVYPPMDSPEDGS